MIFHTISCKESFYNIEQKEVKSILRERNDLSKHK